MWLRSVLACEFPRLGVFPRDVAGMVEVQEQALAAVEKAEAEEVVIDERRKRPQDDMDEAEAAVALGNRQLRAQRRITVHVAEVESERGIGVVNERVVELFRLLRRFPQHVSRYFRLQFAAVVRVMAGDESLPTPKQS